MKTIMKNPALFFLLLIFCGACGEKFYTGNVDCDECYTDEPENYDLVIDVTINSKYSNVPVTVYYGDVEDNNIVATDTAYGSPLYVYARVGRKYSVKAEYKSGDGVVYAVDGTHMKALSVSDACDEPCYVVEHEKMDVRLRNGIP